MAQPTPEKAAATPPVTKGPATVGAPSDQLPQGAATQLNQGMQQAQQSAQQAQQNAQSVQNQPQMPENPGAPTQGIQISAPETSQMPLGDNEDGMLFGPTSRPDEHVTTGGGALSKTPPPQDMARWLPALRQAAQDPNAPKMFKEMLSLLTYHISQGT
jgi:hypothetical protein